jgi:hypothetical protein
MPDNIRKDGRLVECLLAIPDQHPQPDRQLR